MNTGIVQGHPADVPYKLKTKSENHNLLRYVLSLTFAMLLFSTGTFSKPVCLNQIFNQCSVVGISEINQRPCSEFFYAPLFFLSVTVSMFPFTKKGKMLSSFLNKIYEIVNMSNCI